MVSACLRLGYGQAHRRSNTGSEDGHRAGKGALVELPVVEIHLEVDVIGKLDGLVLGHRAGGEGGHEQDEYE